MNAAMKWADALAKWEIPEEILTAAPESPWSFPASLFARRADTATRTLSPSNRRALEALPDGGSVLDVGCGGGAGSLPLASRAAYVTGVDPSDDMLEEFEKRARKTGSGVSTVQGAWPDSAGQTPVSDVVVCHHVFYNAPELAPFAVALTDHARKRVVVELTRDHPLRRLNDLWKRFHGIDRPNAPTANDAAAVLNEAGLIVEREDWTPRSATGFASREDLVAFVRRRLCLPKDRDREIEAALAGRIVENEDGVGFPPAPVVTLWWNGSAR